MSPVGSEATSDQITQMTAPGAERTFTNHGLLLWVQYLNSIFGVVRKPLDDGTLCLGDGVQLSPRHES